MPKGCLNCPLLLLWGVCCQGNLWMLPGLAFELHFSTSNRCNLRAFFSLPGEHQSLKEMLNKCWWLRRHHMQLGRSSASPTPAIACQAAQGTQVKMATQDSVCSGTSQEQ